MSFEAAVGSQGAKNLAETYSKAVKPRGRAKIVNPTLTRSRMRGAGVTKKIRERGVSLIV